MGSRPRHQRGIIHVVHLQLQPLNHRGTAAIGGSQLQLLLTHGPFGVGPDGEHTGIDGGEILHGRAPGLAITTDREAELIAMNGVFIAEHTIGAIELNGRQDFP